MVLSRVVVGLSALSPLAVLPALFLVACSKPLTSPGKLRTADRTFEQITHLNSVVMPDEDQDQSGEDSEGSGQESE